MWPLILGIVLIGGLVAASKGGTASSSGSPPPVPPTPSSGSTFAFLTGHGYQFIASAGSFGADPQAVIPGTNYLPGFRVLDVEISTATGAATITAVWGGPNNTVLPVFPGVTVQDIGAEG